MAGMTARLRQHAPAVAWHWLGFFALVLGAWAFLFAMQIPAEMRAAARLFGPDFWETLCTPAPGLAGLPALVAMWAAMAAAMMMPTAAPALKVYDDLCRAGAGTRGGFGRLVAGYGAVWLGFAVLGAGAQAALAQGGLVTPAGQAAAPWMSALLLAVAGGYQFSPLKAACLRRCRHPLGFFMAHWAAGPWRMGLRLGLSCLGCCWALMALAFVGGTMNLIWMGLAMVLMTLEKLDPPGRVLTLPAGFALLAAAGFVALA